MHSEAQPVSAPRVSPCCTFELPSTVMMQPCSEARPMLADALARFPRLELHTASTPLEHLPRLSRHLGRDIWIKRDDLTPLALGGNKARKLEYLGADALAEGADVLVT